MPSSSDELLQTLRSIKVVAMMEIESLTDRFEQIMLTEDQAKQVRDAIFKALVPDGNTEADLQTFEVITNDEVVAYLPNVQDAYAAEKIKEAKEHLEA